MRGAMVAAASLSVLLLGAQMVRANEITTTVRQQSFGTGTLSPVQPDARTTLIMNSSPASSSSLSSIKFNEWGGNEHYAQRLQRMSEQIDLGVRRGFINHAQAERLRARRDQLASLESCTRAAGFPKLQSDDLEKQMNGFQIDIHNRLTDGMKTAGAGVPQ